jgi:hypothetical protein
MLKLASMSSPAIGAINRRIVYVAPGNVTRTLSVMPVSKCLIGNNGGKEQQRRSRTTFAID